MWKPIVPIQWLYGGGLVAEILTLRQQVRKLSRLYAENATERINLYVNASIAENHLSAVDVISQAKPLAATGNKLLRTITLMQEGILWEQPWSRFSKPHFISPGDRLQGMEKSMKGIEIALNSCPHLPAGLATQELTDTIPSLSAQLALKLEQARCFLTFNSTTPEPKGKCLDKVYLPSCNTIIPNNKNLSAFFFLSCLDQFLNDSTMRQKLEPRLESHAPEREELTDPQECSRIGFKEACGRIISILRHQRLLFASNCSLSLGLAVLIGLTFNKKNGYWSGLTIAISFTTGRQAILTVANARAQGTAIGSVYGVLGSFVFKKFAQIRFVALIPWIIFTSFLRHNRMYGQAGGISPVIGALLILGRNNYGPPNEFAIERLTEAAIGLCCFILVELLLQPTRASTLVKRHLNLGLDAIQECTTPVIIYSKGKKPEPMDLQAFNKIQQRVKSHVHEFENFIEQAEVEPNFWFLPFRSSSYWKLHDSLSNMADILHYLAYNLEFLLQVSRNHFTHWKELQEQINHELEFCKENLCSSLRCLEKAKMMKSLEVDQELRQGEIFTDLERGNFARENTSSILTTGDHQIGSFGNNFLQRAIKCADAIRESESDEGLKGKMVLALCSLGFCLSCFMRETKDTQTAIKEVIQWETTSS